MDSTLNIRTLVDSAPVTKLRSSVADLRKEYNGLSADQRGSSVGKQMASDIKALNTSIKQANPNIEGMRNRMREVRAEHRLVSLGMMSLIGTFDAFGSKGSETVKTLQGMAGAALGVQFAFASLGKGFAAWSGPAALVMAAAVLISKAFQEDEAITTRLNTAIDAQADKLLALGRISEDEYRKSLTRKREELATKAPGLDWPTLLTAAGLNDASTFTIIGEIIHLI